MTPLSESFLVLGVGCLGWALGCGVIFHLRRRKRWAREEAEKLKERIDRAGPGEVVPFNARLVAELTKILSNPEHRYSKPRRFE